MEELVDTTAVAHAPSPVPTRTVAYVVNDPVFGEPFEVYEGRVDAWWMDMKKVTNLTKAFTNHMTVAQACVSAGISYKQYLYFNQVHPHFGALKERLREVFGVVAKVTVGQALKEDAALAFRFLQGTEPETYRKNAPMQVSPDGGSVMTLTEQSFMDDEGRVVMKRKTAEYLENHGQPKE